MEFAARTERMGALRYHFRRQRDVAGDHQIAGADPPDNFIVRDIEARSDLQHLDDGRRGHAHRLIRDQGQGDPRTLGRPEQDLFDHQRTGIRVHPDFQSPPPMLQCETRP
jgi:hypothetical protein